MSSDSTGVEPPSPHPLAHSPPTARKQSLLQRLRLKSLAPIAFETQAKTQRKHRRSSSFSGFVSRILPSHREEKGYTLRQQCDRDSTQDPVDLVFGILGSGNSNEHPLKAEMGDGGHSKKTWSLSPRRLSESTSHLVDNRMALELETAGKRDGPGGLSRESGLFQTGGRGPSATRVVARAGPFRGLRKDFNSTAEDLNQHSKQQNESQVPLLSLEIPELEVDKITNTRKMFVDKKARREQRRSLRESGDYLGVQGANPRNGLWDFSSGTSSSEPSQMSEETKKKLDEEVENVEKQKRKYEEAKAKHQAELSRVQSLRDSKKKEKEKRKSMDLKMKQRRHGKWKLSEDGWRSVAEPELSPIVQSVVGSPARETAPGDLLFPMPSAAEPTPYINPCNIGPGDYFGHRNVSSPLASKCTSAHSESPSNSIPRKPVGSPIRRQINVSSNTIIHTATAADSDRDDHVVRDAPQALPPKSSNEISRANVSLETQILARSFLESISPSQKFDSFLDSTLDPLGSENLLGKEAIATLSRSASTSQAECLPLLDQSPKAISPAKRYSSLREFPPVTLRDPFAARIPLSSRPILTIWAPPTIPASPERQVSQTTIHTTTTTGSAHPQPLHAQLDGPQDDTKDSQTNNSSLQRKTGRIPLRITSLKNSKPHIGQSRESQVTPADIATSSEHLLAETKRRTARLCHTISPGGDKVIMKSTRISISTSQPTHQMVLPAARIAVALTTFQNPRQRAAMKNVGSREDSLTPLKPRTPRTEAGNVSPTKGVHGDHGGIEDPFKTKSQNAPKARLDVGWEDGFVVWHPSPNTDKSKSLVGETREPVCLSRSPRKGEASPVGTFTSEKKAGVVRVSPTRGNDGSPVRGGGSPRAVQKVPKCQNDNPVPKTENRITQLLGKKGGSSGKRALPKSAPPQYVVFLQDISRVIFRIIQTAWGFVECVFDPKSDVRKRWERGSSTGKDVVLFMSAAAFVGATLWIAVLVLRAVIIGIWVVGEFWSAFRILTYF